MILNFKEIPKANGADGLQDTFELFARDFLQYLGYAIIEHPDRGADRKKDMIAEERIDGLSSTFTYRWLVSCKHYAHTGNAVKDTDEPNITERLKQHKCDGFMGIYSTLCSTSLGSLINGLTDANGKRNTCVYDHERIESCLLENRKGQQLAARYFPQSMKKYIIENPVPAEIFNEQLPITCDCCGANLLQNGYEGIYCLLKEDLGDDEEGMPVKSRQYKHIYFACKGKCDDKLRKTFMKQGLYDCGWEDISDLTIPTIWFQKFCAFVNGIYDEQDLTPEVFKRVKQMFVRSFPYIARHLTTKERERVSSLLQFGILD